MVAVGDYCWQTTVEIFTSGSSVCVYAKSVVHMTYGAYEYRWILVLYTVLVLRIYTATAV